MNTTPKVSVIIPVYNTERYLRECLDSVVNQTLRDIEIICVDNGSTDGSPKVLREYQGKDERITILKQEKSNAGAARNLGMSIAVGEYLSFLDSDDFFELTMLEHMYMCAKSRNADIVVCDMKVYHEDSNKAVSVKYHIQKEYLPTTTVFSFYDIKRNSFRCIMSYVWDKLIRRELVTENHLFFQSQPVYNDAFFVYTAMMSAKTITVLWEYLVFYRKRSAKDSITNNRHLHIDCVYSLLSELKEYLVNKGVYERYKRDLACYAISMMHITCLGGSKDSNIEKEKQNKIALWLDEFDIAGHKPEYYYELTTYLDLLHEIKSQNADVESARIQQELHRLKKYDSLSYRFIRYIKINGLRCTIRRMAEKIKER